MRRLACLFALAACTKRDAPSPVGVAVDDAAAPAVVDAGLAPLEGPWFQKWDIEGGGEVFATVPVGIREKRPVLVGVHGAGDRADWACSEWFATTAGWPLIVCPKGVPSRGSEAARSAAEQEKWAGFHSWSSAEQLAARADRAVSELRKRYGAYVDDGPMIFAAWSQGATLASNVVALRPRVYDTAVLVEAGHTPLDPSTVVANLEKGGVTRVVVSCSSIPCRNLSKGVETAAKRRSLPFLANDAGLRGHTFDEPVFRSLGPTIVRLVEKDPRWLGLGRAIAEKW